MTEGKQKKEWYGTLPLTWNKQRIKTIFALKDVRSYRPLEEVNLISVYSKIGVIQHSDIKHTTGNKARNADGYKVVNNGDIIVNILLCWMGAIGLSKYDGVTSPAYDVYTPKGDINSKYYHYLFRLPAFSGECYKVGKGIMSTRWRTYSPQFSNIVVPVPPRPEQDQIVRFLDWKVSAINRLIAVKRKQISLLYERQRVHISHIVTHGLYDGVVTKSSGTKWIGDIPEHWQAMRCKYLFRERDERSQNGTEQHLSMSQKYGLVPDSQLDERRMLSESYAGGKLCYKDDLVLNRLKAHLGVFALSPQSGVISPDYTVLIPNTDRILPSFAETVLKSDRCRGELRIRVRGIIEGFWRLYTDDFNTIILPIPPLEEQAKIMEYIAKFCDKAKKYEDILTREISNLQEFKIRLISDTVTGKIDVRDIEVPDFEYVEEIEGCDSDKKLVEESAEDKEK